jgi:hypothetical protein
MLARMAWAMLPCFEHDGFAGLDVGGYRPEGDGKLLEVTDVVRLRRENAKERLDGNAGDHAGRQRELAVLDAEFRPEQRLVVVELAPDRDFLSRRLVAEDFVPIGLEDDLLDLLRSHARGERAADDRAHARAGPRRLIGMRISSRTLSTPT